MSEEFDNDSTSTGTYSPFWPLLILILGFVIWLGYGDFIAFRQQSFLNQQFDAAKPTLAAAQNWQGRYGSIMKDLNDTSSKDTAAAAILKDAVQAGIQSGLIRVQPGTNTTPTPAAPAKTP